MTKLIELFQKRSQFFLMVASLLIVAGVGLVDYVTGHEISMSVFYLLAVSLAAWFVGKWFAVLVSVLSVATGSITSLAAGAVYSSPFVPVWNAGIILVFYLVVVWLLTRLRLMREELEERVRQRTAALTEEIAGRVRLEREILEISEREQRRIGHDLHDSLCQHLTGTALAGQVLGEKLASQSLPEAADADHVVALVEDAILLSRNLAKGLHPIDLEARNFMDALEEFAVNISDMFKVSCRFECDVPVLIHDKETATHLFRIAQEAVSNSIKHGKAKNILVHLENMGEGVALSVQDDGVGLPGNSCKSEGMGLRIMAHRASMIGGSFKVQPNPDGGTIVICSLPNTAIAK